IAAGTALLSGVTLSGNAAQAGNGGNGGSYTDRRTGRHVVTPGGDGGWGVGGGLSAAGGTGTRLNTSGTANTATGGTQGHGGSYKSLKGADGTPGQGVGGGLGLMSTAAVSLDAFTVAHVTKNHASTSDPDIYGP